MKRTKVIYVISRIDKAVAFEWVTQYLDKDRFDLRFVSLNSANSDFEQYCKANQIACKRLHLSGKSSYPILIFRLFWMFVFQRPKVVHAHLIDANLTALPAAWLAFVPCRIYTRHHSTYHHEYFPRSVRWDRWCNRLSTKIVAISENVKTVLINKEGVKPSKIVLIHHGFDLDAFAKQNPVAVTQLIQKYNPENRRPVVGVVARFTKWKGIQYIIPAFAKLLEKYPKAKLLLFNANGEYKTQLLTELHRLPEESWETIAFENDVFSIYTLFDLYIHTPINQNVEAFGQTYIEALAVGVPAIFTLSGVAHEFIIDRQNALVVPFCDSESIYSAMIELLGDNKLAEGLIHHGRQSVNQFGLEQMIEKLEALYGK